MGTCILVPRGVPLSSIKTMLLLSNFGTLTFCVCLRPTRMPFFFCPLIATITLSPIKPTPGRNIHDLVSFQLFVVSVGCWLVHKDEVKCSENETGLKIDCCFLFVDV